MLAEIPLSTISISGMSSTSGLRIEGWRVGSELPEKVCENVACAMKGTKIRTDRDRCLSCDRELTEPDSLSNLLGGDSGLGDLFGNLFGKKR